MPLISFGPYQIKRELGRGAMGVVYEAADPGRGVDVALKVLAPRKGLSSQVRQKHIERFVRESRTLAALTHPNIVRVYDQGEIHGRPFFSMELVRGTTLRDRVRYQGPLSVPELVRLALEICSALEHMHCRDVVHRDIKPENIMLLPDGQGKLTDFGVARLLSEEEGGSGFHGSPAYMSPEQVAGQPVDGRSDLYSLALTLYEAATGRRAVEGTSIPEILHKVTSEYPPPPAGLPFYLQGVLLRGLAKDPAFRYSHAGEMAADIRAGRAPGTYAPTALSAAPSVSALPLASPVPPQFPSEPVFLGRIETEEAPPTRPEPALPAAATFMLATPPALGPPVPASAPPGENRNDTRPRADGAEGLPRPMCHRHHSLRGIAICGTCREQICYGCLVEIPEGGVLCRGCAFR
jgi:serine/threonine protein kinase